MSTAATAPRPTLPPAATAADDPAAFAAAVVAYDRAEAQRRRENRWPAPMDDRYIDTEYFVGALRTTRAAALRTLFDHDHVGVYMRRLAYYILHTWRVQPAGVRITYDVFALLYRYAPLRDDDINVAAVRYWFTQLITDPLAASLARFDPRGTLDFPVRDVITEGFVYGDPPRAFSSWVWSRRQQPVNLDDIYIASRAVAHRRDLYLWEILSYDTAIIRYMAERQHTEPAVMTMQAHRRRRAQRRLRVAFRAVWGVVTCWRLYQRWALHPSRLCVATSALSLATAATRTAFGQAEHSAKAEAEAPPTEETADRFSIAAALASL